jgi:hypothetical protein
MLARKVPLERRALRLNRHPGLDPGSTFLRHRRKEDGCRVKPGMTMMMRI